MLHPRFGALMHEPPSVDFAVMLLRLEFYSIRPGPDELSRITRGAERRGIAESWLVDSAAAEGAVLLRWARFHIEALGFAPLWRDALSKGH